MRTLAIVAAFALLAGCTPPAAEIAEQDQEAANEAIAEAVFGCADSERNLFSCTIAGTTTSVCAAPESNALTYRGAVTLPAEGATGGVEAGRYATANGGVIQFLRFQSTPETPVVVISEVRCGPQCWDRFEGVVIERADGSRQEQRCEEEATIATEGDAQLADAARAAGLAVDDGNGPRGMERFPQLTPAQP